MPASDLELALRILVLFAIVLTFFGPARLRARGQASRSAANRANAEPAKRDIFLRDRPTLMLLVWGGIPFALAFVFLFLVPAD